MEAKIATVTAEDLVGCLDSLRQVHPDLAKACGYYSELLPILLRAQDQVSPIVLDGRRVQQKLSAGEPIFLGETLPFSPAQLQTLFAQVCDAIGTSLENDPDSANHPKNQEKQTAAERIREAALDANFELIPLVMGALSADAAPLETAARDYGLDLPLLASITQNCMKPSLYAWTAQLSAGLDLAAWGHGICPFCGSLPAFAELRGSQRTRFLRCSLCGADWPFNRLQCASCESTDTQTLGLIWVDGEEERKSIQTCDGCHFYLKLVTTLEPLPAALIPVVDLETISLDVIANQRGYQRPS